ncbi:error-prone DNA polymerase [Flagellatimonas centrodinii]|uniref:error-prone DNA polymerase n=1 Tax=Flagellatimonas centrodinii TaxID=2806210 RepID=UPI001FF00B21|nr:error-prone DNA polymerase [Flagellatimonas centrodinii]ULQ45990.1 error-prone DNA polymerase [Flagellatimonas centrodinii]
MSYAELHCLSSFSFLRGASSPQALVETAIALGYHGLALTDECTLSGVVRGWEAAKAQPGFRFITGTEIQLAGGPRLLLLAQSLVGYRAISHLITRARRDTAKGDYHLAADDLPALPEVAVLWLPGRPPDAAEAVWLRARFDPLWMAVSRHLQAGDRAHLAACRALARRYGLRPVATGAVHHHDRARGPVQDVLTSLRLGIPVADCGQRLFPNHERHLRPLDTLQQLYPAAWLQESVAIAERCQFDLGSLRYQYPAELVPQGHTPISWLRQRTAEGARQRWPTGIPPAVAATMEKELALIEQLQFEAFFLTVEDVVRFARRKGILCQGRGSAANSAVCYALHITEVNPEFHELLFERFISVERGEAPDIDVDFEHQRREEVIQYIYDKYGRHRAALAATVIHWRPRSALRDAGKALGIANEAIDHLAKSHAWWDAPEDWGQHLEAVGLSADDPRSLRWLHMARELIDLPRHLSQHVGGFVIAENAVADLVPVENAAMPDRSIIQWDKDDLESLGLLKVDVLALGMLTAIRRTLDSLQRFHGTAMTMQDIPREDAATYDMLCRGESLGVFQVESRAQMNMLPRLKPRSLYDLTIQVAIVRPGPIQGGMVHPFLKRRQQLEPETYPHEDLRKVLGRTSGVPIFQEQVMQIAVVAAGFSPGEADQVRRSMAAWKRKGGLQHFQDKLMAGMAARGYDSAFAEQIYQQILGFGAYGFPESHAASFALLAYVSAWLKCHHPAAFICGLLNSQPMGFYPPSMLVREAQRCGVTVHPVDVQHSEWDSHLQADAAGRPALRLGLRQVDGFNENAAQRLVAARTSRPFTQVADLVQRSRLNARERNVLARADALRSLAGHRHQAQWAVLGLQSGDDLLQTPAAESVVTHLPAPTEGADILHDYASTGLTLRRHPLALLRGKLNRLRVCRNADLDRIADGQPVRVSGLAMFRQRPGSAKGVMFLTLEDETGIVNLIIRPDLITRDRQAIVGGRMLVARGRLQRQQGITHVMAEGVEDYSHWVGALPRLSRDFH